MLCVSHSSQCGRDDEDPEKARRQAALVASPKPSFSSSLLHRLVVVEHREGISAYEIDVHLLETHKQKRDAKRQSTLCLGDWRVKKDDFSLL